MLGCLLDPPPDRFSMFKHWRMSELYTYRRIYICSDPFFRSSTASQVNLFRSWTAHMASRSHLNSFLFSVSLFQVWQTPQRRENGGQDGAQRLKQEQNGWHAGHRGGDAKDAFGEREVRLHSAPSSVQKALDLKQAVLETCPIIWIAEKVKSVKVLQCC